MKKSYKVAAVILALVMLFSVASMTGFAKSSFSDEVQQVSTIVGAQKCFKKPIGTESDCFGTETSFTTMTDCTTKTDCGSFFSRIFEKICSFFRSIFSLIGLS